MSKQTHRDRVKGAARKRRQYLRKKATAWFWLGLIGVIISYLVVGWLFADKTLGNILALTYGSVLFAFWMWGQWSKVKTVPYVPPVAEQLADLPAEEVLLRGSDQPAATPEELLRAAHAATVRDDGALLRPRLAHLHDMEDQAGAGVTQAARWERERAGQPPVPPPGPRGRPRKSDAQSGAETPKTPETGK